MPVRLRPTGRLAHRSVNSAGHLGQVGDQARLLAVRRGARPTGCRPARRRWRPSRGTSSGPLVGERVADQVGPRGVEHADRPTSRSYVEVQASRSVSRLITKAPEPARAVEQRLHRGADGGRRRHRGGHSSRLALTDTRWRGSPGSSSAEAQRRGQGRDDLGRRVLVAALLEPDQVVDADAGERGQLGAPQAGGCAGGADGQADLGGRRRLARARRKWPTLSSSTAPSLPAPGRSGWPCQGHSRPASPGLPAGRSHHRHDRRIDHHHSPRPGRWALDTNHFPPGFAVRHLGVSKVRGHFAAVEAELVVGETPRTRVTATVDIASIDTGNKDRDAHVLPEDCSTSTPPDDDVPSTRITGAGADWILDGELTIGDVTQPVTLDVELGGTSVEAPRSPPRPPPHFFHPFPLHAPRHPPPPPPSPRVPAPLQPTPSAASSTTSACRPRPAAARQGQGASSPTRSSRSPRSSTPSAKAATTGWSYAPGQLELLDGVKAKAKANGLWNFFLPDAETGQGLSNLDYAYIAAELGKNPLRVRVPQLLGARHREHGGARAGRHAGAEGAVAEPLLNGEIRSCFGMTEPDLASSTPATSPPRRCSTATSG